MSSPPKEKAETRAGHPPAVKAGGMRIVQKHPHNSDAKEEKDKDDQDWETSSGLCNPNLLFAEFDALLEFLATGIGGMTGRAVPPSRKSYHNICVLDGSGILKEKSPPKPAVFISGVIARGDKDFPPAAAQVAHQKPHPSVEKLPHPQHVKQHIHQPRK